MEKGIHGIEFFGGLIVIRYTAFKKKNTRRVLRLQKNNKEISSKEKLPPTQNICSEWFDNTKKIIDNCVYELSNTYWKNRFLFCSRAPPFRNVTIDFLKIRRISHVAEK